MGKNVFLALCRGESKSKRDLGVICMMMDGQLTKEGAGSVTAEQNRDKLY